MAKEPKEPTEQARLPRTMLRRIRRIAAHRDVSVPDYIAERFGPLVDEDEREMLKDIQKERKAPRDKPAEE